ncbi:MAG: hypothetical protein ACRCUE_07110 [Bosea sp. (in: a-proteobacteria)]
MAIKEKCGIRHAKVILSDNMIASLCYRRFVMQFNRRGMLIMSLSVTALPVSSADASPTFGIVPNGFSRIARTVGAMDGEAVTLVRHMPTRSDSLGLGGPHVSVVTNVQGVTKGFTRMDPALAGRQLPSASAARRTAITILERSAPDLLLRHEINWVKQHDERITVSGREITISGMKVKCRNLADGKYFWVIVGSDSELVTFERDIIWNFAAGYRKTQKWLHDTWLKDTKIAGFS